VAVAETLELQVRAIRLQAHNILSFELVDRAGQPLPVVQAGAHVDVHLPGGLVRSYSLAGDPEDRSRWVLGVLREDHGQGGSRSMHDRVRVGGSLRVSQPKNEFALNPDARRSILLAGGIGITPIKAMAHALWHRDQPFELHYCARSQAHAAFLKPLTDLLGPDYLHLHFDDGDPSKGLDIGALLATHEPQTHLYYCGPSGFMAACDQASQHWPSGTVHREYFKAPASESVAPANDGAFTVHLVRSGQSIVVQPDQTIVRALELSGQRLGTSCMAGLCGTCKVNYVEGEVDHRDYILTDEEKTYCLTACVSRAKGATLSIDL
jgi:vanillate O-demethylase ferredoxin subunit